MDRDLADVKADAKCVIPAVSKYYRGLLHLKIMAYIAINGPYLYQVAKVMEEMAAQATALASRAHGVEKKS